MTVVAVYMPVRGGAMTRKTADLWDRVEEEVEGVRMHMVLGDLNAELDKALERAGRTGTAQDRRLQAMLGRCGQVSHGVGRPTYRDTSEIDHILTSAEAAQYMGRTECKPGEREGAAAVLAGL